MATARCVTMEIRRQRMSIEEYRLLPFHPGWEVEYVDGEANFRPREAAAYATLAMECRPPYVAPPEVRMRMPEAADADALCELYRAAFIDTALYAGLSRKRFAREPRRQVTRFLSIEHDTPLGASRVAVTAASSADDRAIVGAAFVRRSSAADVLLDVLMIAPCWQRRGLGTALLGAVCEALAASGFPRLVSRWHLANDASSAWHRARGFVEEPDLFNAKLYLRAAEQELRRFDQIGPLSPERREELERDAGHWAREVERLNALLEAGDTTGTFAFRRFAC